MPSPFPGMDPWLEGPGVFPDLHNTFITFLRSELNRRLPPPFRAAIATRIYMEDSDRRAEPDVDVFPWLVADSTATLERPLSTGIELPVRSQPDEEITEPFVEIRTTDGGDRLVTSVEILSPTNKRRGAAGRGLYLAKQQELRLAGVNLVEIDLLRSGTHSTAVRLTDLRASGVAYDYHVCTTRADRPTVCFVVPIRLSDSLPQIAVPLTDDVEAISIDLQSIFERCYDDARYERAVRYSIPCEPPLSAEQSVWADDLLKLANSRPESSR